jgi:hypothetical protein
MSCFKPFKIIFRKERDNNKNNHSELDKTTLFGWADKTLDQSLSKINIKSNGFKATRI